MKYNIDSKEHLEGGAQFLAGPIADYIQEHVGRMPKVLEAFSGTGRIGFKLLERGLCDTLVLSDVNPEAINCCERTIHENKLQDVCTTYVSDVWKDIPEQQFDLIVANAPSYERTSLSFPNWDKFVLRGCDQDWKIHGRFYARAKQYLKPGGLILANEVEPHRNLITIGGLVYDERTRNPIDVFREQIEAGGLKFVRSEEYIVCYGYAMHMIVSENAGRYNARHNGA